jgi:hypothetical protein|nr:MAG TPA: hypothetical protein [Caudoviricetes sp.]
MTTEDNFETLFQTYTRDKIDEIVGEVREKTTSNTESLRVLQAQSDENLKKAVSLQAQSDESKEGIRALQNRLSESQTQASNLVQAAKSDLEKKNSDLAERVKTLESAPSSEIDIPERLDWGKELYTYQTTNYKITVYHIIGPIYYVYVDLSSGLLPPPTGYTRSVDIQIPQEIASLKLYFAPQKLSTEANNDAPFISSTFPGANVFHVDEMKGATGGLGRGGFYAISVANSNLPNFLFDSL